MKVFLNYSFDDQQIVQKVRDHLVHHDIDVFDAQTDIAAGDNITASINDAMKGSDAVLFFVSKNSNKSSWVHQERSIAISNKLQGQNVKLIPIPIEKNVDLPFFLKDYLYLDISEPSGFEDAMVKLMAGLRSEKRTSIEQDLTAKISNITIEREFLKRKTLEHKEYLKLKSTQIYFSFIITLFSAIVVSIGLLSWSVKIENSNLEWLVAFLIGAMASMIAAALYMRKEKTYEDDLFRRLEKIQDPLKNKEAHNQ